MGGQPTRSHSLGELGDVEVSQAREARVGISTGESLPGNLWLSWVWPLGSVASGAVVEVKIWMWICKCNLVPDKLLFNAILHQKVDRVFFSPTLPSPVAPCWNACEPSRPEYECSCFTRECRSWIREMAKLRLHKDQVIATTTEAVNKHIDLVHSEGTQLCMMGQYCSGYQKFRMRKHMRYPSNRLDGHDRRTLTVLDGPRPSRPPSVQVVDTSFKRHGYGNRSMEPSGP